MAGIAKAKSRQGAKKERRGLNVRRKLGLVAKAGRRRPPHIKSVRDKKTGKRDWVAA